MGEYSKAEPSLLSKNAISEIAESIAGQLQYEPGESLEIVLKKLGGRLVYKDFWDSDNNDSGSIKIHGPKDFEVYISSLTSGLRDRFTIAHEIGHYILHFLWPRRTGENEIEKVVAARYGSDRTEWEANWFAAAFLMPEVKFKTAYKELGESIPAIAAKFRVSEKAAEVRVSEIIKN